MADPICRWRNPYVTTIVELVKVLPHETMSSDRFREIVERRWPGFFHTPYQLACQTGLYYESDEGIYYPRFDHDIDESEAFIYMKRWITRYYVPNPYTRSLRTLQQPQPFLASIIGYIYEHPDEKGLHSILESVFQENIGNIDIISNILNTYTDLLEVDNNGNIELTVKAKDFMKQFIDRNDKKAFFEIFSEEVKETQQEELLRQASAATFLRKALMTVIEEDSNLSKLAAVNKYRESTKSLKINGFRLWRMKDDLPLRTDDVCLDLEIEYNHQAYVMYLEWTPADMESMFFPVFNNAYSGMFAMTKEGNEYVLYKISENIKGNINRPLQQIFYGAPGTGKSHKVKGDERVKFSDVNNFVFRTTFHPDSDYSTFVGAYKPTMKPVADKYKAVAGKDEEIAYEFIPQAFLQAYIAAWNNQDENVFLIIEEINRGNCAQIFGDLFQLLDRDDEGFSEYPIRADRDIAIFLNGKDDKGNEVLINKDGIKDGKLKLPKNLYIWATMNTSDQSLFPIDSAFKRRWDWVYMPIGYKNDKWTIEIGDKKYNWVDFQHKINDSIYAVDNSEDKQLGDYFVNADRTDFKISADTFLNKILFYIWNDVCKDDPDQIFQWNDGKKTESIKFSDFFGTDRDKKLQGFMSFHKVPAIGESTETDNSEDIQNSEGTETNETPAGDDNEVNS